MRLVRPVPAVFVSAPPRCLGGDSTENSICAARNGCAMFRRVDAPHPRRNSIYRLPFSMFCSCVCARRHTYGHMGLLFFLVSCCVFIFSCFIFLFIRTRGVRIFSALIRSCHRIRPLSFLRCVLWCVEWLLCALFSLRRDDIVNDTTNRCSFSVIHFICYPFCFHFGVRQAELKAWVITFPQFAEAARACMCVCPIRWFILALHLRSYAIVCIAGRSLLHSFAAPPLLLSLLGVVKCHSFINANI